MTTVTRETKIAGKDKPELRCEKSNYFLYIYLYIFFIWHLRLYLYVYPRRISEALISISFKFPINDSDNSFTIYLVSLPISFRYIVGAERSLTCTRNIIFCILSVLFNQCTFFSRDFIFMRGYFILHIEKICLRDLIAYK